MKNPIEADRQSHKKFAAHQKLFNSGMQDFQSGFPEPLDKTSPAYYGWKAAQEMAQVKQKWLIESRKISGVE